MSTEHQAIIVVGLPENELATTGKEALFEGHVDSFSGDLSPLEADNLIGFKVTGTPIESYTELDLEALQFAIDEFKAEFFDLTQQDAKVYISGFTY